MSTILEFTLQTYTADQLTIKVKNASGAPLKEGVTIELYPLKSLLDQRIKDKATEAATSQFPAGAASLEGIAAGATGWSVWARAETSDTIVPIVLLNDKDQTGRDITPVMLDAGAEFIIRVPLNNQASRARIDLDYSYEYGVDEVYKRVDGKLELKPADADAWIPQVSLTTDAKSPTMIKPADDVRIFWEIKDGVSATLRGPLPGGNSEWSLSSSSTSDYYMGKGSFKIKAVGPLTYILQAEVKRPDGKPNVQVIKMLSLDVHAQQKYGYVNARPRRVLPNGLVEIDWAAWGVKDVIIDAGGAARKIPLTDMTLSGDRQGMGVMRLTAGKPEGKTPLETTVDLNIEIDQKLHTEAETKFRVIPWRKMEKSEFTGQPLGMAVAAPQLALLTTDGLWIANVGNDDFTPINYDQVAKVDFTNTTKTESAKAWLALAALGKKFVVLRQPNDNDLQVALYTGDGKPDEIPPLTLPPDVRPFVTGGANFDFMAYRNRAYFVVEKSFPAGVVRRAFSVGFDSTTKKAEFRSEQMLELMPGYRLLTFDGALYAVNRNSGQMIRCELTTQGKLEVYKAASAVDQQGASMTRQGLFVAVGRVLAVLSPASVPSLASLESFGLRNVLRYQNLTPLKAANTIQQDIVYSTQNNRWSRCGHGLDSKVGVVAFRGGDSERLWFIEPTGDTYTLTVSSEHLFLHDFVTDLPSKPLAAFLNRTRQFTLINNTGMQFVPPNETCVSLGLTAFSATSPVEMVTPPNLGSGKVTTFELRFNEAEAAPVTLRFMVQRAAGVKHDYVLELTLLGPGLSSATTVFKRIAPQQYGGFSIAEVPGTREHFNSTIAPIEFFPKPLVNGIRLSLRNATPYQLWRRSPDAADPADREKEYTGEEIKIAYNTPAFSLYAHGAGELFFDVDFALPVGIEEGFSDVNQRQRIRVRKDQSRGLIVDSFSSGDVAEDDFFKRTLRYKYDKPLSGVFIGDGAPSKDGASIYVPLAHVAWTDKTEITKYRASDLLIEAHALIDGGEIFTAPNSVAVLSDRVLAAVRNNWISELSLELKSQGGFPTSWHDVITNLKSSPADKTFFTLGMKEKAGAAIKHSYSYAARTFPKQFDTDLVLDSQKGFRPPPPVSGAPAWVSPTTISPMDAWSNLLVALCVQGGMFQIVVNGKEVTEVEIPGAGREEAVVIDADGGAFFCAHQSIDKRGLIVSRIAIGETDKKQSITLPGSVTGMITNPQPPAESLRYNCPRAVSLIATPDALFVSHGRNIYVLDKTTLEVRQTIPVNLPCRLIQVRRGKLSSETDPKYGTPRDCYIVWAIGSMYVGNGQDRKNHQTSLYKIGIV